MSEVKELAELKSRLEKRLRELEEEIEHIKALIALVDHQLVVRSFRKAEEAIQVIPLKTKTGVKLADMYVSETTVRVVPAEGMAFNVETPPFQTFLVSRVFDEMKTKDEHEVREGKMKGEHAFSYAISQDGIKIREILIRNYRDRLPSLKSSIRWTLEKMYEKTGASEPSS